jgi:uncharacterized pyridoxal phosphate-containing UPF0001 family protein
MLTRRKIELMKTLMPRLKKLARQNNMDDDEMEKLAVIIISKISYEDTKRIYKLFDDGVDEHGNNRFDEEIKAEAQIARVAKRKATMARKKGLKK